MLGRRRPPGWASLRLSARLGIWRLSGWSRGCSEMAAVIRKAAPGLKPHMQYGMLGYGPVKYRTKSGSEGEWFVVGLANQTQDVILPYG